MDDFLVENCNKLIEFLKANFLHSIYFMIQLTYFQSSQLSFFMKSRAERVLTMRNFMHCGL